MSGWSDPQKGGRAVGAALYPTLSSLLSTAPQPGVRATASDAPGSMLFEAGGKWAGDPGRFASDTDANYVAYLAAIAAGSVYPAPSILIGLTPATAVAYAWDGAGYIEDRSQRVLAVPRRPISPAAFGASQSGTVTSAQGFTERTKSADKIAVGFDVVWMNGAASAATLVAAKWGIAAALTGAAAQVSPASLKISGVDIANASIPAGVNGQLADVLISDFVNVSLPAGTVVEIRSNIGAEAHTYNHTYVGTGAFIAPAAYMYSCEKTMTVGATGDVLTGNPSVTCATGDISGCCFVRFYYEDGTVSVLSYGDSIMKGDTGNAGETSLGNMSPLYIAGQLDTRISVIPFSKDAGASSVTHAALMAVIPKLKPSVVLIPSWSPNDGYPAMQTSINRAMQCVSVAQQNGCIAALITPNPWSAAGASLTLWQAGVDRVRAIYAKNPTIIPVDFCAALEDPANPGKMLPQYFGTATDGGEKHPNDAGRQLEAEIIVAALQRYL